MDIIQQALKFSTLPIVGFDVNVELAHRAIAYFYLMDENNTFIVLTSGEKLICPLSKKEVFEILSQE